MTRSGLCLRPVVHRLLLYALFSVDFFPSRCDGAHNDPVTFRFLFLFLHTRYVWHLTHKLCMAPFLSNSHEASAAPQSSDGFKNKRPSHHRDSAPFNSGALCESLCVYKVPSQCSGRSSHSFGWSLHSAEFGSRKETCDTSRFKMWSHLSMPSPCAWCSVACTIS